MVRDIKVNKQELTDLLNQDKTTREIGDLLGVHNSYVYYLIKKWKLRELLANKRPKINEYFFSGKIVTKEQAYALGFIIADGTLTEKKGLQLSTALVDKEILSWFSSQVGCNVHEYHRLDKKAHIYPNAKCSIGSRRIKEDLHKLFGGYLKNSRRLPIISKKLESFLLQGFFDADGCITWGIRKDRNRIWQKVSFTSSLKLLTGVQNILLNSGYSTRLRPKTNENCFVLELASKEVVVTLMDLIYSDITFLPLKRKHQKFIALRLELGEFGERTKQHRAEPTE